MIYNKGGTSKVEHYWPNIATELNVQDIRGNYTLEVIRGTRQIYSVDAVRSASGKEKARLTRYNL